MQQLKLSISLSRRVANGHANRVLQGVKKRGILMLLMAAIFCCQGEQNCRSLPSQVIDLLEAWWPV